MDYADLSIKERMVVQHLYIENCYHTKEGRFVFPIPKNALANPLGESHSQAMRRFLILEQSLCSKGEFEKFNSVF